MKCDRCDNEATVHELLPKAGGKTVERHLCESCARQSGVAIQNATPITQILSQFLAAQAKPGGAGAVQAAGAAQVAICRACGITYAQFRQTGLLGCPDCYRSFEAQLGPMLQRAHEGGTHHTGKSPAQALNRAAIESTRIPTRDRARAEQSARAGDLKKKLAEAIASEQYELAARLRDELAQVEAPQGAPHGGGEAPPGEHGRAPGMA